LVVTNKQEMFEDYLAIMEGQFGELSVQKGNKLSFLGMSINIQSDGSIHLDQDNYIKKCLEEFEKEQDILKPSSYPANLDLFEVDEEDEERSELSAVMSHAYLSWLMTLMFAAIRTRPDILLSVTFLAVKVKSPTVKDWANLKRVFGYLKKHPSYHLTFVNDKEKTLEIFTDASFRVHADTAGHSGLIVKLFGSHIYFKSGKQKLITKSSTEAELIALDEAATYSAWINEFLIEINEPPKGKTIIYQDNMSTMVMAQNGKGEFKRTKHIANRYYWIKQFIDSGAVALCYLSTDDMIADFLTKPLKGLKFWKFLSLINGIHVNESINEYLKTQNPESD
jgi:hypothetical protein